ncbi:hypothetical protein H8N00_02740 [Streptomyces sp. AC563]|uniref:hypothetical protein n=1 Tax=Streptomyces buecherae TaxID=2763006 RepID=UPI00164CEFB4|nr:hypothetical protein [Streptomyces buecherae]MBC3987842.1 hypothetical protein [Streptomyces buecherae]
MAEWDEVFNAEVLTALEGAVSDPRVRAAALATSRAEFETVFDLVIEDEAHTHRNLAALFVAPDQPMRFHVAATLAAHHYSQAAAEALLSARSARDALKAAAMRMRQAEGVEDRRTAAREFLTALADLLSAVVRFLVHALLLMLSRLLCQAAVGDVPVWQPVPLERTPEITPRGPNSAFPVNTHRGGHHGSCALGSAVLAA